MILVWLAVLMGGVWLAVFAVSWWAWDRRRDQLAKPGGSLLCRLVQSVLFASIGALLWWIVPLALAALWWRRRRPPRIQYGSQLYT